MAEEEFIISGPFKGASRFRCPVCFKGLTNFICPVHGYIELDYAFDLKHDLPAANKDLHLIYNKVISLLRQTYGTKKASEIYNLIEDEKLKKEFKIYVLLEDYVTQSLKKQTKKPAFTTFFDENVHKIANELSLRGRRTSPDLISKRWKLALGLVFPEGSLDQLIKSMETELEGDFNRFYSNPDLKCLKLDLKLDIPINAKDKEKVDSFVAGIFETARNGQTTSKEDIGILYRNVIAELINAIEPLTKAVEGIDRKVLPLLSLGAELNEKSEDLHALYPESSVLSSPHIRRNTDAMDEDVKRIWGYLDAFDMYKVIINKIKKTAEKCKDSRYT